MANFFDKLFGGARKAVPVVQGLTNAAGAFGVPVPGVVSDAGRFLSILTGSPPPTPRPDPPPRTILTGSPGGAPTFYGPPPPPTLPAWFVPALLVGGALFLGLTLRRR